LFATSGSFDSTFSAWDLPHCWPPEEVYVMKPAQEKIEKIDQHLRIQPLQRGNLLYIT